MTEPVFDESDNSLTKLRRRLIDKGKNEEALNMLAYYHAGGDVAHPTVQFEYREIKETIRLEKEVLSESSYLDFFRSRGNRWRLAIIISLGIISQYSGNALFSNYINLIYEGAGITDSNQTLPVSVTSYFPTMFEMLT
jgi:hypothetical protein